MDGEEILEIPTEKLFRKLLGSSKAGDEQAWRNLLAKVANANRLEITDVFQFLTEVHNRKIEEMALIGEAYTQCFFDNEQFMAHANLADESIDFLLPLFFEERNKVHSAIKHTPTELWKLFTGIHKEARKKIDQGAVKRFRNGYVAVAERKSQLRIFGNIVDHIASFAATPAFLELAVKIIDHFAPKVGLISAPPGA